MRVLNIILVLFVLLTIVHVKQNMAARVLNMENIPLRLQSLNKGPVPPSGPSGFYGRSATTGCQRRPWSDLIVLMRWLG
ncbi:hypothetical protein JHK84_026800 [Glycine max]|nr:hypothetical protein JHK86_026686 [Glycine max]KAG5150328.1 hypothetical protein JHK84_026800 [Glycine max]